MDQKSTTAARELAARRHVVAHICAACGKSFNAIKRARFCSRACANHDYRVRQRGDAGRTGAHQNPSRRLRQTGRDRPPTVTASDEHTPPLVMHLDALRHAIMQGRRLDGTVADLINEAREERQSER